MRDGKNTSLNDLFDDADNGICSNGTQGSDVGLTSNGGLTVLTHGFKGSDFFGERREKNKKGS